MSDPQYQEEKKKENNPNIHMVWDEIIGMKADIGEIKKDISWLKDVTCKLEKRLWQIPFKIFVGIVGSTVALFIANLIILKLGG